MGGSRMSIRGALSTLAVCAGLALASAAGPAEASEVRFLHNETDPPSIEFFNKTIAEFEAQNPDIQIQMEAVSTDARLQKLMAATAAKTMPDLFKILPEELFQLAQLGYIADLGGLVEDRKSVV